MTGCIGIGAIAINTNIIYTKCSWFRHLSGPIAFLAANTDAIGYACRS